MPIFQSHLVCTILTPVSRNVESDQFDDEGGCGWEGCVMVENMGLHRASGQEFYIIFPTTCNVRTGTCE